MLIEDIELEPWTRRQSWWLACWSSILARATGSDGYERWKRLEGGEDQIPIMPTALHARRMMKDGLMMKAFLVYIGLHDALLSLTVSSLAGLWVLAYNSRTIHITSDYDQEWLGKECRQKLLYLADIGMSLHLSIWITAVWGRIPSEGISILIFYFVRYLNVFCRMERFLRSASSL